MEWFANEIIWPLEKVLLNSNNPANLLGLLSKSQAAGRLIFSPHVLFSEAVEFGFFCQ